jgi:hypothetical protein
MLSFERRWAKSLLSAFAPAGGPGLSPLENEVDYVGVLLRMKREATPLAALGMRVAIWIGALAPLWLWGKLATVTELARERRPELLRELLGHRVFAVRELTLLLKLCAAMALLGAPTVRLRSGYDHVKPAAKIETGVRLRIKPGTQPGTKPRVLTEDAETASQDAQSREAI